MSDNDDLFGSGLSNASELDENEFNKKLQNEASVKVPINHLSNDINATNNNDYGDGEVIDKMPIYDFVINEETYLTKFPNFISVEPNVFDEETYEAEACQDEFMDDEGRVRLKLKIGNAIRWRYIKDSNKKEKESNSKIIKWSDGSMSLHIGSEVFDIISSPMNKLQNQLFIKDGNNLCCKGMFINKFNFKPSSTSSDTHKRVTVSLADRLSRSHKIQILNLVSIDPNKERLQRIQQQDRENNRKSKEKIKIRTARESNVDKINISTLYDAEIEELEKKLEEYQNPDDNDDIFSEGSDAPEESYKINKQSSSVNSTSTLNDSELPLKRKKTNIMDKKKEEEEEW